MIRPRAIVVGDVMLDLWLDGRSNRRSPEAKGAPVVNLTQWAVSAGGAANVATNLRAQGIDCRLFGVVGADVFGQQLDELLRGVATEFESVDGWQTTTKARIMVQGHQIARLDSETPQPIPDGAAGRLLFGIRQFLPTAQVVVLSDYNKGVLTPGFIQEVISLANRQRVPVIVDPKGKPLRAYYGAQLITPNSAELPELLGDLDPEPSNWRHCVDALLHKQGAKGLTLIHADGRRLHLDATTEAVEVCGAGDVVVATLAASIAHGHDIEAAARRAVVAAGIGVSRPYTSTCTGEELEQAMLGQAKAVGRNIRFDTSIVMPPSPHLH